MAALVLLLMTIRAVSLHWDLRLASIKLLSIDMWTTLFMISVAALKTKYLLSRQMLIAYLYAVIAFIMSQTGHFVNASSTWLSSQVQPLFLALVLYELFVNEENSSQLNKLMLYAAIFIGISCILNIRGLIRYPLAVRAIVGGGEGAELSEFYSMQGISNYGFFSGLPSLVPAFFYCAWFSHNVFKKWFFVILIVLVMWAIVLSSITTPLLIAMIALFLAFFGISMRRRSYAVFVMIFLIILSVVLPPQKMFNSALDVLIKVSPVEATKIRLRDIQIANNEGIEVSAEGTTETTVEQRLQRVFFNLETISKYPIFGSSKNNAAGAQHMFWLYFIATMGIVGFMPFLVLFFSHIRRNLRYFDPNIRYYYLLSVYSFIAMGLLKGANGWFMYTVVFFLMPGMYEVVTHTSRKSIPREHHR
jgi:hypothetical protein